MRLSLVLALFALVATGCDTGGSGSDFGPPRTAQILKVTVSDAPLVDENGDGWDGGSNPLGDGPEIYFRLFDDDVDYETDPGSDRLNPRDDASVEAVASGSSWYSDVTVAEFPLVWDVDPGYVVRDLDDPLYVALFDYDPTTGDDPMAYSETFDLRSFAPATVDGEADVITLIGNDRTGNRTDFSVRLTVRFDD